MLTGDRKKFPNLLPDEALGWSTNYAYLARAVGDAEVEEEVSTQKKETSKCLTTVIFSWYWLAGSSRGN